MRAVVPVLVGLLVGLEGAWGQVFRIDSPPDCEEQNLSPFPGDNVGAAWLRSMEAC